MMIPNSGSFRDPAGRVFCVGQEVFRSVFAPGVSDYEAAREQGTFERLFDRGWLLPHHEESDIRTPEGTIYCLRHPRLPFVSYPWEWCFSMLKDAALLHLDIMEELIPRGFWLRDASAFNVQYDGERLRLIDTLSVGQRPSGSPWVAYRQFCSHFLAPLSMAAWADVRLMGLWRSNIDGIPLDLAVKMLPFYRKWSPRLFMHLVLHAHFQQTDASVAEIGQSSRRGPRSVSDLGLLGIVRSLRRTVSTIRWKRFSQIWDNYSQIRTYSNTDLYAKTEFVHRVMERIAPKMVWDFGSNTGEFSRIAAEGGAFVVSIEGDPGCVEYLYTRVRSDKTCRRILPLLMDLANPSPGLGWAGHERFSLTERGPADLLLALALLHHLVLANGIPFERIARWFSELTTHAIIEFVPHSDPMIAQLLKGRESGHLPCDEAAFLSGFGDYFDVAEKQKLQNGRILYLFERKS